MTWLMYPASVAALPPAGEPPVYTSVSREPKARKRVSVVVIEGTVDGDAVILVTDLAVGRATRHLAEAVHTDLLPHGLRDLE